MLSAVRITALAGCDNLCFGSVVRIKVVGSEDLLPSVKRITAVGSVDQYCW